MPIVTNSSLRVADTTSASAAWQWLTIRREVNREWDKFVSQMKAERAQQAAQADAAAAAQAQQLKAQNVASTLADLSRPRPQLSPTDELALFANPQPQQSQPVSFVGGAAVSITQGRAVTVGDGAAVQVDNIVPAPAAQVLTINVQAQAAAASTYARNHDVVFDLPVVTQLAA